MKTLLVAKHKFQWAAFVALFFLLLLVTGSLVPANYTPYVRVAWLIWFIPALWLFWSLIAPLLVTEQIQTSKQVDEAFNRFERALETLITEQVALSRNIQDTRVHLKQLTDILVGFIEEANQLKAKIADMETGKIGLTMFHDAEFGNLLAHLSEKERGKVLDSEIGILAAQEQAYRRQAGLLVHRVVAARGKIAQQHLKLRTTEAAQSLLQMGETLAQCEERLSFLNGNQRLPTQKIMKQYLLN